MLGMAIVFISVLLLLYIVLMQKDKKIEKLEREIARKRKQNLRLNSEIKRMEAALTEEKHE